MYLLDGYTLFLGLSSSFAYSLTILEIFLVEQTRHEESVLLATLDWSASLTVSLLFYLEHNVVSRFCCSHYVSQVCLFHNHCLIKLRQPWVLTAFDKKAADAFW